MGKETAIVEFSIPHRRFSVDLEVPLTITANELVIALNTAYELNIDTSDINNCFFFFLRPIALLRGDKTLSEFGIRNGSLISYAE